MSSEEESSEERSGSGEEEEDEESEDPAVEVENSFYSAQDAMEDKNFDDAIEGFEEVIELEQGYLGKKKIRRSKMVF